MHIPFILMDEIFKLLLHVGHLPRRFPAVLPVDSIGYIPHKLDWVRHRFNSYNFSFILSGGGEYWCEGKCWRVQAPCVITQSPWHYVEYGPCGEWNEWEELYLIYNEDRLPLLEKMKMIRRDVPVWNIKDSGPTRSRLLELRQAEQSGQMDGFADRVDRLCELMVIESILGETAESLLPEEQAILDIRDHVQSRLLERHDFHELARQHGLSDSTFRRYWAARVGMPPARYTMRLKIEEACRLLVESRMKVGQIADHLGFADRLYFSRRFRHETGMSAADYRRSHQSPLSFVKSRSERR